MKTIKPEFDEGIRKLKMLYNSVIIDCNMNELQEVYNLCSQTEDWVTVVGIKWYYGVDARDAIRLYHTLEGV